MPKRAFVAMAVLRELNPEISTWPEAAHYLGLRTPQGAYSLVRSMQSEGTRHDFASEVEAIAEAVRQWDAPIDYRRRRMILIGYDAIPDRHWLPALEHLGVGVTTRVIAPRRSFAAAWVWSTLTGGDWHHAPSLGLSGLEQGRRRLVLERYRRFERRQVTVMEPFLQSIAQHALLDFHIGGRISAEPARAQASPRLA